MSLFFTRKDDGLPHIDIILFPKIFRFEVSNLISSVLPLFERHITISFFWTLPKSPCIASAAWRKTEGCPVELNVATSLLEILAKPI